MVAPVLAKDPSFAHREQTRALVRQYISDIWNRADFSVIPEVCSPKIRFNNNNNRDGPDSVGHKGVENLVSSTHASLTDYQCEIVSMIVEDGKAFCRLRMTGKHTRTMLGFPPTGQVLSWLTATEFVCDDGAISEVWELMDWKMLDEQLQFQCFQVNCLPTAEDNN
jgi:steroid delta-isomerase-like uncharacterized protein